MKTFFSLVLVLTSLAAFAAPATESEIADLYRTILLREQDQEGAAFWLKSGLSKEEIRKEFLKSPEFKELAKKKLKK